MEKLALNSSTSLSCGGIEGLGKERVERDMNKLQKH
jgi:hypothetical protein